jgi:hypothetical protein
MFRYRLRTLLIVLTLGPPLLAWGWFKYQEYRLPRDLSDLMEAAPFLFIIDDSALFGENDAVALDRLPEN